MHWSPEKFAQADDFIDVLNHASDLSELLSAPNQPQTAVSYCSTERFVHPPVHAYTYVYARGATEAAMHVRAPCTWWHDGKIWPAWSGWKG